MMYSIFGSCAANGINPYDWLMKTLKVINDSKEVYQISYYLPLLGHSCSIGYHRTAAIDSLTKEKVQRKAFSKIACTVRINLIIMPGMVKTVKSENSYYEREVPNIAQPESFGNIPNQRKVCKRSSRKEKTMGSFETSKINKRIHLIINVLTQVEIVFFYFVG